jgi:hypothetical protein
MNRRHQLATAVKTPPRKDQGVRLGKERIRQLTRADTSFHGKPTNTSKAFISALRRLPLDMPSPHSDMTTSQPLLVNTGKLEFVEIRRVDLLQRPVPGPFTSSEYEAHSVSFCRHSLDPARNWPAAALRAIQTSPAETGKTVHNREFAALFSSDAYLSSSGVLLALAWLVRRFVTGDVCKPLILRARVMVPVSVEHKRRGPISPV